MSDRGRTKPTPGRRCSPDDRPARNEKKREETRRNKNKRKTPTAVLLTIFGVNPSGDVLSTTSTSSFIACSCVAGFFVPRPSSGLYVHCGT